MIDTIYKRIVIDTNVWVSAILFPKSVAAFAVVQALANGRVLTSQAVFTELSSVLERNKFDSIQTLKDRRALLSELAATFQTIKVTHVVTDCRDPKDNMFLELALSGDADIIITGDQDLLTLHPWRGIAVLTPRDYLDR